MCVVDLRKANRQELQFKRNLLSDNGRRCARSHIALYVLNGDCCPCVSVAGSKAGAISTELTKTREIPGYWFVKLLMGVVIGVNTYAKATREWNV